MVSEGLSEILNHESLKVLIVDDHSLLAEVIVSSFSTSPDLTVDSVALAADGLSKIDENGPYDAILLDYDLPDSRGLSALTTFIERNNGRIAIFSGVAGDWIVQQALRLGAAGYVPKTTRLSSLKNAIRMIADGDIYLPVEYIRNIEKFEAYPYGLTQREQLVLNLLGEGMQNKEICRILDIELAVAKLSIRGICKKLSVANRTQAAIAAKTRGLI